MIHVKSMEIKKNNIVPELKIRLLLWHSDKASYAYLFIIQAVFHLKSYKSEGAEGA